MKSIVLVVDDCPDIIESMKVILHDYYIVFTANTALKAIAIAKTVHIDAILLDLNLPDSCGFSTIELMQKECPQIPIVAFSGYLSECDSVVGNNLEAVPKGSPVEKVLLALIKTIMKNKVSLQFAPAKKAVAEAKELVNEMKSSGA